SQFFDLNTLRSLENPFTEPTKVFYSISEIQLDNVKLTGHIIVHSQTKIVVSQTASLNDIVLIAPEIEIKDFVSGKFQAIATKIIDVGKQVQLDYPSALIVKSKPEAGQQPHVSEE